MSAAQAGTAVHPSASRIAAGRRVGARRPEPAGAGDHIDRLYRAARGMCASREDAEDLVHDTLARAWAKPRFGRSNDDPRYLLQVLRKTFSSGTRFARCPPEASPRSADVYRAIAALPEECRDALIAVDLMGLSYGEAARALRVREATIATRLHSGRRRVAEMLES